MMDTSAKISSRVALVVDDDGLIRMDAASILEDAGFQTLEAEHTDAALAVLHEHHPTISLLFTDVQMPGARDGFALAREVAHHWPHISIVVASGRLRPKVGDLPDTAHFIAKPFSAEIIYQHLRRAMPDEQQPERLKG